MPLHHPQTLFQSHRGSPEACATACHPATRLWYLGMVTACMWLSELFIGSDRELHRNMARSLPGNLGHPPVIYNLVQMPEIFNMHSGGDDAEILFNSLPASLRTSIPARSRVRELCVLLLSGDCRGAQQSGQGKTCTRCLQH